MIRSEAFDPPEYRNWTPDPDLVQQYHRTITQDANRRALIEALDRDRLLELYRRLLRARLIDQALSRWVRQGVIAKAWLGTGEEAVTTGPVYALDARHDYALPVIRNHAASADLGLPLSDLFRTYLGAADGPSQGRDLHLGSFAHRTVSPISSTGAMVPVALGMAMAMQIQERAGVMLTWVGDGSTKSGPTHEGFNFAAVRKVPAVFIIQNNQVALGTRLDQHHLAPDFADWPEAYGMAGASFDGNHVLDAWAATALAVERCRRGEGPVMLVANTFRMGGHATHDEREARATLPAESFAEWGKRDPVGMYEEYLKGRGIGEGERRKEEGVVRDAVEAAVAEALASRDVGHSAAGALERVYAPAER